MPKRILIAAGGTAGHLYPAISLARELKKKGVDLLFAAAGLENHPLFPKEEFKSCSVEALSYQNTKNYPKVLLALSKGVLKSMRLIKDFKPDLVIGFGSYHSAPVLITAALLRKKIWINEQNVYLGKANQFLSPWAKKIYCHYPLAKNLQKKKVRFTAMPIRESLKVQLNKLEARSTLGLNADATTLMVFGGSQGALAINDLVLGTVKLLGQTKIQVIHLVGPNADQDKITCEYRNLAMTAYVKAYDPKMETLYTASDFVISRSGASTIAELVHFELPAILIPYPYAGGHQEENALYFESHILGGTMLPQKELTPTLLSRYIHIFLDANLRSEKARAIHQYKQTQPLDDFHLEIEKELNI